MPVCLCLGKQSNTHGEAVPTATTGADTGKNTQKTRERAREKTITNTRQEKGNSKTGETGGTPSKSGGERGYPAI